MTTTIQTQSLNVHHRMKQYDKTMIIFTAIVNTEDGENYDFEIEAADIREAHAKANAIAQARYMDISYIELYQF